MTESLTPDERELGVAELQDLVLHERTKRKRMQNMLATANSEAADHQMRIIELQAKEQDRDRLQQLLRVANLDLEQSQLSMMLQKAEYEEALMEARAKAEAQGLSDQAREAQIKKVLDAEHTAARKKAAETEARLKGVVTALNRDLELSQLGAMNLQSEVAKCKEELLEKEAEVIELRGRLAMEAQVRQDLGYTPRGGTDEVKAALDRMLEKAPCVVCHAAMQECAFLPCGHMCVCRTCASSCFKHGESLCPICRAVIDDHMRIYTCAFTD